MPLEQCFTGRDSIWGYWRISEDEGTLAEVVPSEAPPAFVSNPLKRLEFLAGRVLIKSLLARWDLPFPGITKDAFGKPFLSGSDLQMSLSHSFPYVAAVLHRQKAVGIDLEQPKPKMLRIGPRVLAPDELSDAGEDIIKHCIYWCAKESLVKIHGKKDLVFSKNLLISPFNRRNKGQLIGRILVGPTETTIPLTYIVAEPFVVVVSE